MENKLPEIDINKIEVFFDHIVVKPFEGSENVRGLINPQNYEDKPYLGIVCVVGKGRVFDTGEARPLQVKVGDVILFQKYSALEQFIQGEKYLIIREEDVIWKCL